MKAQVAGKYTIVGGAGHTTETLRLKMNEEFPEIKTEGLPEAKIFEAHLETRYGLHADFLECNSTNCGSNIMYLLDLLKRNHISCNSIILAQDAAMQYRMEAGLRKYAPEMNRYINLLMGEIVHLYDDSDGYGPKGKNFIAHVDIPVEIREAFSELEKEYAGMVRKANPLYASSENQEPSRKIQETEGLC